MLVRCNDSMYTLRGSAAQILQGDDLCNRRLLIRVMLEGPRRSAAELHLASAARGTGGLA